MSNATDSSQSTEQRKKITLVQPENGNNTYTADVNTDIVLDFVTGDAAMTKSENEKDLVFTFTDASGNIISTITIEGFYDVYDKENLPAFFIPSDDSENPIELTAEAFFTGNEDLLPAAGGESPLLSDHTGTNPSNPSLLGGLGEGLSGLQAGNNAPDNTPQTFNTGPASLPDGNNDGDDNTNPTNQPTPGNSGDLNDLPVADVFTLNEAFKDFAPDTGGTETSNPLEDYSTGSFYEDLNSYRETGDFTSFEEFLKDRYSSVSDSDIKQVVDSYNKLQEIYGSDANILQALYDADNTSSSDNGKIINVTEQDEKAYAQRAFDDYADKFGTDHVYGNDGAATNNSLVTSYALSFATEDTSQISTGITVGKGKNLKDIYLYEAEDGSFVARTQNDADTIYFKLSVNENGQLIVTEYLPTNGGDINTNTCILTRTDTITDGNNDTNSDSASIEIELNDITIRKNPLDYVEIEGNNNKGYTVSDADAANLLIAEKTVTNIDILTDDGKDLVKIVTESSAGLRANGKDNEIFMNKDDDTVFIDAGTHAMRADDGNNTISTGKNEDMVTLIADKNAMWADAGNNTVDTGKHNDTIEITAGTNAMYATDGVNTIHAGEGKDSVAIKADEFAMLAKGTNSQNIIDLDEGADELYIQGDLKAVDGGLNKISGGKGDDFIFIEGSFVASGDGKNEIYGGQDNDLIKLTASGLKFGDVLSVDGGNDMDILLTGVDNLDAVKKGLKNGDITNIEIAIAGDVKGGSVDHVLNELGLDQDGDGKIATTELQGWTPEGNAKVYNGQEYQEYTKGSGEDQITLLIQTNSIV